MKKILFLVYAILTYIIFGATFCYAVGFVTNLGVSAGLDSKPNSSLGFALLVNVSILVLFAVQHSVMARPAFKQWWTTIVPEPLERSTYVLFSNLCLILLFICWQPMGGVVWSVDSEIGYLTLMGITMVGFGIVLVSTFLINHFDLFGLRQVWLYFTGKPYTHLPFKTPFFYKYVRHPLYLGWMIAFWAAPTMTVAHFLFALICTGYMLTAIRFEERDLVRAFGDQYTRYKQMAPMLIPFAKKKRAVIESSSTAGPTRI